MNESDGKRGNVGKMPNPEEIPKCPATIQSAPTTGNMSVFSAQEKHSSCPVRWKTIIWCDARENIQPVPSLLKLLAGAMRRKRIQPVFKRGKTFNRCQVRENY